MKNYIEILKFEFLRAKGATHANLQPAKVKFGFTLAEVLITLGIIGIVAAMTIPTLLAKLHNRHTESMLKEDYSILQQMMTSANDDGAMSSLVKYNDMDEMKTWFQTYFLPYIKVANVCYDEQGCWNNDAKYLDGGKLSSYITGCGLYTISFQLFNGSYVCMDDFSKNSLWNLFGVNTNESGSMIFFIDTNGDKKPNILGKDIFILVFKPETGKFVPAGSDKTEEEVERNCSKSGDGRWCLTLVKNRGWKVPDIK